MWLPAVDAPRTLAACPTPPVHKLCLDAVAPERVIKVVNTGNRNGRVALTALSAVWGETEELIPPEALPPGRHLTGLQVEFLYGWIPEKPVTRPG